jgi:hypothetical protein
VEQRTVEYRWNVDELFRIARASGDMAGENPGSPPPLCFDWKVMMIRPVSFNQKVMTIVMCTSSTQTI